MKLGMSIPIFSLTFVAALLLGGCRAIRRGETQSSIDARRISRQGIQAMREGNWQTAEGLFNEALTLSENDDRAHRGLAETHWQRDEQVTAIQFLEKAVHLSGRDPKLVERLGRMYLEVGRIDDAEEQSSQSLAADRQSATGWLLRGDCKFAKQQYEEALACYHRALAIQPDLIPAQHQSAEIYQIQGRFDRLLATLDSLPDGADGQSPARIDILRGIALRELGRPDDAVKSFHKATVKDPNNAQTHLMIASLQLDYGAVDRARISIANAEQIDPKMVKQGGWVEQLESRTHRLTGGAIPFQPTFRR